MAKKNVTAWAAQGRKSAKRSGDRVHPAAKGGSWLWPVTRIALLLRGGLACWACGGAAEKGNPLTVDHVVAWEDGGTNRPENLACMCLSCNSKKGRKSVRAFLRALREEGVETAGVADRLRVQLSRPLPRAEARKVLADRKALAA